MKDWHAAWRQGVVALSLFGMGLTTAWSAPPLASAIPPTGPEADALCIAVLKQDVKAHLHDEAAVDMPLNTWQLRVEAAFALSGEAYHQGLSEKEARALLDVAERTVAIWSDPQRKAQVLRCEAQGRERLKEASPLEKLVVRKGAQRWLQRERARQAD